jgi:hypothetical protein
MMTFSQHRSAELVEVRLAVKRSSTGSELRYCFSLRHHPREKVQGACIFSQGFSNELRRSSEGWSGVGFVQI